MPGAVGEAAVALVGLDGESPLPPKRRRSVRKPTASSSATSSPAARVARTGSRATWTAAARSEPLSAAGSTAPRLSP